MSTNIVNRKCSNCGCIYVSFQCPNCKSSTSAVYSEDTTWKDIYESEYMTVEEAREWFGSDAI